MLPSRSGERGGLERWWGLVDTEAIVEGWFWRTTTLQFITYRYYREQIQESRDLRTNPNQDNKNGEKTIGSNPLWYGNLIFPC